MESTREEYQHPLHKKGPDGIHDWKHWMTLWELAETVQELEGLIYCGYDVSLGREDIQGLWQERFNFYLRVADGYTSRGSHRLITKEEKRSLSSVDVNSLVESRQKIAKKAFDVLCRNVFKDTSSNHQPPSWADYLIRHPERVKSVMWFFDPHERPYNIPYRNSTDHNEKIAIVFLRSFIELCWLERDSAVFYGTRRREIEEFLLHYERTFIHQLRELGNLDLLWKHRRWLTEEHLEVLRKIALHERTFSIEGEQHNSVESALFHDSYAARIYFPLHVWMQEMERQRRRKEAEGRKRQAERELRDLGQCS